MIKDINLFKTRVIKQEITHEQAKKHLAIIVKGYGLGLHTQIELEQVIKDSYVKF